VAEGVTNQRRVDGVTGLGGTPWPLPADQGIEVHGAQAAVAASGDRDDPELSVVDLVGGSKAGVVYLDTSGRGNDRLREQGLRVGDQRQALC
jgi:hypothetical protein